MNKIHETFLEIMRLAMEIKEYENKGSPQVFVDYTPHVGGISVRIFEKGWHVGADSKEFSLYADGADGRNDFKKNIACYDAVANAYKKAIALDLAATKKAYIARLKSDETT